MSAPMSHSAQDLAASRAQAPHTSMFLRMLVRAAILRRGRALRRCLPWWWPRRSRPRCSISMWTCRRSCGASFATMARISFSSGRDGASLPADALSRVDSVLADAALQRHLGWSWRAPQMASRSWSPARISTGCAQLDRWWSVSNWPSATRNKRLIGVRALPVVAPKDQPFDLSFQGKTLHVSSGRDGSDRRSRRQPHLYFADRFHSLDGCSALDH